jgi:hypothetical protein
MWARFVDGVVDRVSPSCRGNVHENFRRRKYTCIASRDKSFLVVDYEGGEKFNHNRQLTIELSDRYQVCVYVYQIIRRLQVLDQSQ